MKAIETSFCQKHPAHQLFFPRASKVRGGEGRRTDRGRGHPPLREKEGRKSETELERGRAREFFCPLPPLFAATRAVRAFARPESRALAPRSPERIRGGGARDSPIVSEGLSGTRTRAEPKSSRGEGAEMLSVGRPTASASPGFHRGRGGETLIILRGREGEARGETAARPPIPVCCGASNGKVDDNAAHSTLALVIQFGEISLIRKTARARLAIKLKVPSMSYIFCLSSF